MLQEQGVEQLSQTTGTICEDRYCTPTAHQKALLSIWTTSELTHTLWPVLQICFLHYCCLLWFFSHLPIIASTGCTDKLLILLPVIPSELAFGLNCSCSQYWLPRDLTYPAMGHHTQCAHLVAVFLLPVPQPLWKNKHLSLLPRPRAMSKMSHAVTLWRCRPYKPCNASPKHYSVANTTLSCLTRQLSPHLNIKMKSMRSMQKVATLSIVFINTTSWRRSAGMKRTSFSTLRRRKVLSTERPPSAWPTISQMLWPREAQELWGTKWKSSEKAGEKRE